MYVRIEKHSGFRIRGFRTKIVNSEDIQRARRKLFSELESQNRYPRVTYGAMYSQTGELLNVDTYFAGIIGDSSIFLEGNEEVIVTSGRYIIARSDQNDIYNSFEFLKMIQEADYFQFRHATIVEAYSRDIETGEESVELWVPIE